MDIVKETDLTKPTDVPVARPANDNWRITPAAERSAFPHDAVARIYKPSRSVMTSGKGRTKGWRLAFERRSAPFIEPLMGWTGTEDTLAQVVLEFPTLASAIRYAEREGLRYTVQSPAGQDRQPGRTPHPDRSFSDATLHKLGLDDLQESYGRAIDGAVSRSDPSGPQNWATPMDVVRDRTLSLDAKRSILINWAWTEYLIDQATNEGMPDNGRPSRMDEVEQALLALEREVPSEPGEPLAQEAA